MEDVKMKFSYPNDINYDYSVELIRINLDKEREHDLVTNIGFVISEPQNIKKDLKSSESIFSEKFGQTLSDVNPFADRYKCLCGCLTSRIYDKTICSICKNEVKFVDDNFNLFGWMILKDPYYIIHPNLFNSLAFFIGSEKVLKMLSEGTQKDQDGFDMEAKPDEVKNKDEPFIGIGMLDMKDRIQEILDFYLSKYPNKKDYYDDIIKNIDNLFIQSIPVYTTHLRPFKIEGENFHFEGTNSIYNMMTRLVSVINKDTLKMQKKKRTKNQLLYDLQIKYNELYEELKNTLAGKKGAIRSLFGGRYNFSARSVIVPNPGLRIDQVTLSYYALSELLQQSIINILKKSYNMTYSDAYNMWFNGQIKKDDRIHNIIMSIIKNYEHGLPILINRNPSLSYGAILQMHCIDCEDNYTMGLSNNVLDLLAGDYDGDTLNIHYIINQQFYKQAFERFNPRNAMYISRNDGNFNPLVNHKKDLLINGNTMINLSRKNYSKEQLNKIRQMKKNF